MRSFRVTLGAHELDAMPIEIRFLYLTYKYRMVHFVRIFDSHDRIVAAHFDGELLDEYSAWYESWSDVSKLMSSLSESDSVLRYINSKRPSHRQLTLRQCVVLTQQLALELDEALEHYSAVFQPLQIGLAHEEPMRLKLKNGWLRLYGLRLSDGTIIISGSAIKKSQRMSDNELTQNELHKIDKLRTYLREHHLSDRESLCIIE